MNKLAEKVKSLFAEGTVKLAIGFENGSHGARPFFCRNQEDADRLIWDDSCTNNIAVYWWLICLHCVLSCNWLQKIS